MSQYSVYAIRDRLLNYFMQPFIAHNDASALASIGETVNEPGGSHAIQKSPHHFEVWRISEITDDYEALPKKAFLADASSLIREHFRPVGQPGRERLAVAPGARRSPPEGAAGGAGGNPRLHEDEAGSGHKPLQENRQGPEGGPLPHSER